MNRTRLGLQRSISEEREAARRYRARAKLAEVIGDTKTARLYHHVAGEEDIHAREFRAQLGKIGGR